MVVCHQSSSSASRATSRPKPSTASLRRLLPLFTDVNEITPASRATRWLRSDYAGKNKRTGKPFASEFAHVSTIVDGKFYPLQRVHRYGGGTGCFDSLIA